MTGGTDLVAVRARVSKAVVAKARRDLATISRRMRRRDEAQSHDRARRRDLFVILHNEGVSQPDIAEIAGVTRMVVWLAINDKS